MDIIKLSIKHFMGDIPRVINENFQKICDVLDKIFNEKDDLLHSTNMEASGKIEANTVKANNIYIDIDGEDVSLADVVKELKKCKEEIEKLKSEK